MTLMARMEAGGVAELDVGGRIVSEKWDDSDVNAASFKAALRSCEGAQRLNVHINSPGGSVEQAVAMRTLIMQHSAPEKHVYIDGMAASAATLIACIGAPVHMARGAMYMIHNPLMITMGDHRQLRHDADVLEKYAETFAGIYAERSGQDVEFIRAQMDAETWFTAEEAVEAGFADDMTGEEAKAFMSRDELRYIYAAYRGMAAVSRPEAAQPDTIDSGATSQEEVEPEMDWQDITLDELRAQRADICAQLIEQGALAERERIHAIDEAAGISDALADRAKYEDIMDAGAYAIEALKGLRAQPAPAAPAPGASYMAARAQETRGISAVAAQPQAAPVPAEPTTDEVADMLAKALGKEVK